MIPVGPEMVPLEALSWTNVIALVASLGAVLVVAISLIGGRSKDRVTRNDAEWQRITTHLRVLEDYCLELRDDLEGAGLTVKPWPPELKRGSS